MTSIRIASAVAAFSFVLSGCVAPPQRPVQLRAESLPAQSRVGVIMAPLPKVNTFFPGAGCLLCLAAAEMMNSSLTTQTKTLTSEDLPGLKDQAADILRKRGVQATVLADGFEVDKLDSFGTQGVDIAQKNFTSLAQKYQVDKLIVFQIDTLGFSRDYSSYIPTSDPKAVVFGKAYMVNLKTNAYEWYRTVSATRAANGAWDEPPAFPGLTNAYYQALELGKDQFLKPLSEPAPAAVPVAQAEPVPAAPAKP